MSHDSAGHALSVPRNRRRRADRAGDHDADVAGPRGGEPGGRALDSDRLIESAAMAQGQAGFEVPDSWGLAGKVAIVTGGGAAGDGIGNGRASAILLARAGTRVVVVDRDLALAKRTVELIEAGGGKGEAIAFQADVTRASDCAAMVQGAVDRVRTLHLLD